LWTEQNRLIVPVLCPVFQSNLYSHPPSYVRLNLLFRSRLEFQTSRRPKLLLEADIVRLH
jgi:hypothetical protein